ncbi:hypothetical protein AgCh_036960 [Apium graveolens]
MASSSKQDIEQRYASMSINDGEEDGLILGEINEEVQSAEWAFCLVGSFITNRKVNFVAMQDTLANLWRPVKGVFMESQIRLEMGEQLSDIKLNELYIWVQIHELPVGFNSEIVLRSIGNYIEKFCESLYDEAGNIGVRNYDASLRAPMRNNIDAGKNQWLRNAGGGKLRPKKMNENVGDDELTRTESVGIMVTRSQNYGIQLVGDNQGNSYDGRAKLSKVQNLKSGKEGENVMTSIGLFIGDPKRRRVYDNKDVGLTEGHSPDDENMVDSEGNIMSNPKNLLEAGAAMQARLGL